MSEELETGAAEAATEDATPVTEAAADQVDGQEQAGDGEDATAESGDAQGDKPRRKQSVQERIDDLTRKAREAERERDFYRQQAELRERQERQPREEAEPSPADYQYGEDDRAYIEDHAAWRTRKAVQEDFQRQEAEREHRRVEQTWQERQAAFSRETPDYHEKVVLGASEGRWVCSAAMADAIRTSEDGPKVAYHLAANPTEARRIAGLSPLAQVREIGRLEGRLSATPAPQPKTTSNAPPPPQAQARGSSGQFKVSPDTSDFAAFEKAYGS